MNFRSSRPRVSLVNTIICLQQEIGIKCVAYTNENDIIIFCIVIRLSTSERPRYIYTTRYKKIRIQNAKHINVGLYYSLV